MAKAFFGIFDAHPPTEHTAVIPQSTSFCTENRRNMLGF